MAKKTNRGISEEAELESAYRELSGHNGNTEQRPRRKTAVVAFLCIAAIVAVLFIVAGCLPHQRKYRRVLRQSLR